MDELRKMQLMLTDILKVFHDFCELHSLRYYAAYGTLLGAARHNGFIPWDDDIDVVMPRPDYERFISSFETKSKDRRYVLEESSKTDNEGYFYPYAKIYDTKTTLIENAGVYLKRGIFLDVFPLDGAGNCFEESKETFRIITKLQKDRYLAISKHTLFYKGIRGKIFRAIMPKWYNGQYISRKLNQEAKKEEFETSRYVCNFFGAYKEKDVLLKEIYGTPHLHQFESIYIYVPEKTDEYLQALYGDWRKLPDVSKRKTHHEYVLDLDKPYTIC